MITLRPSASHENGLQVGIGRPRCNIDDCLLPHTRLRPRPPHELHEPTLRPVQRCVVPCDSAALPNLHLGRRPTE